MPDTGRSVTEAENGEYSGLSSAEIEKMLEKYIKGCLT